MNYDSRAGNDLEKPRDLEKPPVAFRRSNLLFLFLFYPTILGFLGGCSLSSTSTARSARLNQAESGDMGLELLEINQDPKVYRVKSPLLPDARIFLAALQECNIVRSQDSVTSVVRQLFVGLEKLQIEEQIKLLVKEHIFHAWQANAMLEETEIRLLTFSIARDSCIMDYVFWSSGPSSHKLSLDTLKENFEEFLRSEIKKRKW